MGNQSPSRDIFVPAEKAQAPLPPLSSKRQLGAPTRNNRVLTRSPHPGSSIAKKRTIKWPSSQSPSPSTNVRSVRSVTDLLIPPYTGRKPMDIMVDDEVPETKTFSPPSHPKQDTPLMTPPTAQTSQDDSSDATMAILTGMNTRRKELQGSLTISTSTTVSRRGPGLGTPPPTASGIKPLITQFSPKSGLSSPSKGRSMFKPKALPPPTGELFLIVDDQANIRKFLTRRFEMEGIQTETAKNGLEALVKMQNRKYDIVFLDIEMDTMDGLTCVRNLRNWEISVGRNPPQRICALTSHTDETFQKKCYNYNLHFSGKPVNVLKLINLARKPGEDPSWPMQRELPGIDGDFKAKEVALGLSGPKFSPGVTVEAWPENGEAFALATIVNCDTSGMYTVFFGDDSVESNVDELRIRYQGQVMAEKLIVGERVQISKGLELFQGKGVTAGTVVELDSTKRHFSGSTPGTVVGLPPKTNEEGSGPEGGEGGIGGVLPMSESVTTTAKTATIPALEYWYIVQYTDVVGKEGLTRETLPRSALLSEHFWPSREVLSTKELDEAVKDATTHKEQFKIQHTLVQSILDKASKNPEKNFVELRSGLKTDPGVRKRSINEK
ncbi:hypothetical protein TrLO_g9447 [Triparma laevis f. longispina]|uniref:Response regulatory domain-containing protein n=1 Tax=Triparma laevis f. longispina TaxID=1714387 RepID=A0A9W7FSL3_9STRA|nr:hypothetical protein TrLO_g9447 [Triparma laevis f. longispina]